MQLQIFCHSLQQLHARLTERYDGLRHDFAQLALRSLLVPQRNAKDRGKLDSSTFQAQAEAELPA